MIFFRVLEKLGRKTQKFFEEETERIKAEVKEPQIKKVEKELAGEVEKQIGEITPLKPSLYDELVEAGKARLEKNQ